MLKMAMMILVMWAIVMMMTILMTILMMMMTVMMVTIALLHDDVTIKIFIKILLLNARDHGCLAGTKQCKFTENRSKNCINSQREVE